MRYKFIFSLIVLLLCAAPAVQAAQTCTTSQSGPSNRDFNGISGSADNNVITVGERGNIYQYDGTSWSSMTSGTTQELRDVFVLNSSLGYAVGNNGTILVYDGSSWSSMSSGTTERLRGVWAYSSSDVWAVGNNGTVLHYNGTIWQDLSAAANTGSNRLEDAWGNASYFYALARNGNLYQYDRSGGTWSTITTCASVAGDNVNDLWGDASGNIYIAGDGGAVYLYNGTTCTQVATTSEDLDGIYGSTTTGEIYAAGKDGTVVYYNGSGWIETSEGSEDINDVWVSSTGNAFYSSDNGYTSTCTYTAAPASVCTVTTISGADDFNGISGSSSTAVISVGKDGEIYQYDGSNWTSVTVTGNPGDDLKDVYVIDGSNSVAVGKDGVVILQSGGSWSVLSAPTSKDLKGVWAYSSSEIYVFGKDGSVYSYNGTSWSDLSSAAGTNNQDDFEDAWGNSTYVYGLTKEGNLFQYTRSGSSWAEITTCASVASDDVKDLWGDASGNIYIAGKGGAVYLYNGTTCTQVATTSEDLEGIYGSTATGEIYAVGKNGTVVYYNGSSWSESTVGSEDLKDVWIANDGTPFYAGKNATLTTCTTTATVDHFLIEHDGTALTCEPESITIKACLDSSCSSFYTSDVSVTLLPTGWVGGDTQTVTGGQTAFELRNTTTGTITLAISSSSPTATNTTQCLNTATSAVSCDLTFYDAGFTYTIPTQTSCVASSDITISAVRLDDATQACIPNFVSRTRDVNFSLAYVSTVTGTPDLTLNHNGTDYTPIDNATSQTVPVNFDASGQATFTVTYPDAGQITLNSQYNGSAATSDAGLVMNGVTTYVTKPAKLYVYSDDANSACAGSLPSCTAFKKAGENFNLKIRAACADNSVTPSFQLSGITLTHINIAPAISQGTIGVSNFDFIAADNGEHIISTQNVSEVGAFTFTAVLPVAGYYGEAIGTTALNTSAEIGRFYPDHFCMTTSSLNNRTDNNTAASCTDSFSFLDEDFDVQFTLSAQALGRTCGSGDVTQNYSGNWSFFATPFSESTTNPAESGKWNLAAINDPAGSATDISSRIDINTGSSSPASGQFTNGQVNVTARIDINRAGTGPGYTAEVPLADVRIAINPVDTDGITLDSGQLTLAISGNNYAQAGNTSLYFGRLFAENAYGTNDASIPLQMWAQSQYCNAISGTTCSDWQPKTDDSCSLYSATPPTDTAFGGLVASDGDGYYQRASPTVTSGTFDFLSSAGRVHVPDTSDHSAGWQLFYTAGGNGGDYIIPFTTHPYLLDFDGTASFGLYRGDDRIIYWREVLE